ncbi:MAG: ABC transporter permease [Alphaproteobacteria bacterium]
MQKDLWLKHLNIIAIWAVLFAMVFWIILPFMMAILWSLVDPSQPWSYPDLFPKKLSFARWVDIWQKTNIKYALKNSYSLAPVVAIISVLCAMPTAYALGRLDFKGKNIIQILSLLPMVVPAMVIAVFFTQLLINMGIYNKYLGIMIGHVVITLPYSIRILSAGFSNIQQDQIDAAKDLGANLPTIIRVVYLPTILPAMFAALIFTFIISIEEFNIAYVLGSPDFTTVPTILYSYLGYNFVRPNAAVVSLILVVPNVLLMLFVEKLIRGDKVYQKGTKG